MHTTTVLTASDARALPTEVPIGYRIEFDAEPVEALAAGDTIKLTSTAKPVRIYRAEHHDRFVALWFAKGSTTLAYGDTVDVLFVVPESSAA